MPPLCINSVGTEHLSTGHPDMRLLQLLYAGNRVSRFDGGLRQELAFRIAVKNLAYRKLVEVFWAGQDGIWRILPATCIGPLKGGFEVWEARAEFRCPADQDSLPRDICFALHYGVGGQEYWDNNQGQNYEISANAGIHLDRDFALLNIDPQPWLAPGQTYHPITAAVHLPGPHKKVFVRWTTDRWHTVAETPCFFRRKHWTQVPGSGTLNPNRYGDEIWIGHLYTGDAFRVEYAIGCRTGDALELWDNNFGRNYIARRERLKVLTLNLHCCQEENQDAKLSTIARAIVDLNADIVCLQEVAEPWNDGKGDWNANTANLIRERMGRPYHLHLDWSHRGFDRYRESLAILSRHPFAWTDSTYVSSVRDFRSINARKIVAAQVMVPYVGPVNVFSTHLSWWPDGFSEQFANLWQWVAEKHGNHLAATLLCGDFNVPVGSEGYHLVTGKGEFVDQFPRGCAHALAEYESALPASCPTGLPTDDSRIDYIFQQRGGKLEAVAARELFTDNDYGRVSDHHGYLVEFEPR